jgi:peptidoglycan/LPS O-acetylase OafA/YrhL
MAIELMFSKANTQGLRGIAALTIVFFHVVWGYGISPLLNMWGAFFVTIFIILSGYGLEESFRMRGLDGFWRKRVEKVVLPVAFFVCAYNYLFPYILPDDPLFEGSAMRKCLDELLFFSPRFWYVFFILKWYFVYWLGTRFMGERSRWIFFLICALLCLNMPSPAGHLEAEQSFSFLAGVLLSRKKAWLCSFTQKKVWQWVAILFFIGFVCLVLKTISPFHDLKGSIAYNYFLCPFRLSIGLAFMPLLTLLRPDRSAVMQTFGKYSMEIYIAHIPFTAMVKDAESTFVFFACSALCFCMLLMYSRFVARKIGIAQALFIIVNVLFVAKYSARISDTLALCATLLAVVSYYVLCRYVQWKALGGRVAFVLCLICFAMMLVLQYGIDPYSLQVDRWSALHFPIQNLLSGVYPYNANTHLGGYASPFPVWQILHVPFYLMGNVGLSFFFAFALFLWSMFKVQGKAKATMAGLLMCSSVAVWYEVAVRSDLLTNMLLLAAMINLVLHRMSREWVDAKCWWMACAVGLLASTRMIVLVPLAILLLPYLVGMKWHRQISVVLLTTLVFLLTFAPFALWDWQSFYHFDMNPWALQTRQGNVSDFVVFLPLVICLAFNHKMNPRRYYRNSAFALAAFVAVTFVHNMYSTENWNLFSSTFDITYISTCLPFCFMSMVDSKDA